MRDYLSVIAHNCVNIALFDYVGLEYIPPNDNSPKINYTKTQLYQGKKSPKVQFI